MWFVDQNKQIREMCDNVTQKTIEECDSRVDVISKTVSHLESQCRQQAEYGEQLQLQVGLLISFSIVSENVTTVGSKRNIKISFLFCGLLTS